MKTLRELFEFCHIAYSLQALLDTNNHELDPQLGNVHVAPCALVGKGLFGLLDAFAGRHRIMGAIFKAAEGNKGLVHNGDHLTEAMFRCQLQRCEDLGNLELGLAAIVARLHKIMLILQELAQGVNEVLIVNLEIYKP